MKNVTLISLFFLMSVGIVAQSVPGTWKGKVALGNGNEITFVFDIVEKGDALVTMVSIPSQLVSGLKPRKTTFLDGELVVDGSNLGIGYKGSYSTENNRFEGQFQEGFNTIPLNLQKEKASTPRLEMDGGRPQEPHPPYPYLSEDITFVNRSADITLAGTFTRPRDGEVFPAVVLISGSGVQDRDGTAFGHKTLLVLADHLTKQGIAVLRFDDRGFGGSTGEFSSATSEDFAGDVVAAVHYLSKRKDVGPIGLIGHSEGGIIAPMVANKMKGGIAFIVSLAGSGRVGSTTSLIVSKNLRPFPVPDEQAYEDAIAQAIAIASRTDDMDAIRSDLTAHYQKTIAPILMPILGSKEKTDATINGLVESRLTPWSRFFYTYDPAKEFGKVTCPVLALNGSEDIQVPADIHLATIEKALANGRTTHFKVKELRGLNHFFQTCTTCKMNEYQQLGETFAPDALHEISTWILKTLTR